MRLLGLTMSRTAEGLEMRVRYSYLPQKPPRKPDVEAEIGALLRSALTLLEQGRLEKAGLQREDMKEERATMSFVEKGKA